MNENLTLFAAMGLGAFHALEPGHGKGVLSAYIISSRAKAFQAVLLGMIASLSHALSIFVIAILTTVSLNVITPEHLIYWLELSTGFFIIYIGAIRLYKLFKPQVVTVRKWNNHSIESHHHDHHHLHIHTEEPTNLLQFLSVGFLTGIIPCPSALAIILAAIGAHHPFVGIKLVIAFSIGGAFTMAALGYLISQANAKMNKTEHLTFIRIMTFLSALLIILLGMIILWTSISHPLN